MENVVKENKMKKILVFLVMVFSLFSLSVSADEEWDEALSIPIALIEHGTPCIVFTSGDDEKESISNAMELKSRGAYIIGIGPRNNEVFDFFIKVREAGDLNSICHIIPIQILAYQLALLRGCDPDKPRNLAKSVTVK